MNNLNKKDWSKWKDKATYLSKDTFDIFTGKFNTFFKYHHLHPTNMNLLEIGCGHGRFTLLFSKLFKKIVAIDPSEILIKAFDKVIKEKNIKNIQTVIASCENFKLKNNMQQFDMIICSFSFMWMQDKQKCLLNMSKLLKKNKYLLILEASRFNNIMDKKLKQTQLLLNDTLKTIIGSKKFELVHHLNLLKANNAYLLKLK